MRPDISYDVVLVENLLNRRAELVDILLAFGFGVLQFARNLLVLLRKPVFHAEVFQFALYREQSEPVCQRCEQIYRFARDFYLLVLGHVAQCPHVVQAVGDFYQYYPDVVRQREQYLAEIFRLLRGVGIEDARHFGQSVDHRSYFWTEYALDVLDRIFGILHHVVKKRCDHGFDAEPYLLYHYFRYGNGMQKVRLARTPPYPLVRLFCQKECAFDEIPILLVLADFGAGAQKIFVGFIYKPFIFRTVTHAT